MMDIVCMIDSREQSRIPYAKQFFNKYNPVVSELTTGDYIFKNIDTGDEVCFEYKKMDDFISSVINGRIFEQTKRMNEQFNWNFIIIDGDIEDLRTINKRKTYMKTGRPFSLAQFYGTIARLNCYTAVVQCHNQAQSFNYMEMQVLKIFDDEPLSKHFKHDNDNAALNYLACIGGVGYKTAELIVSEFNIESLNDLLNVVETEDLTSIKGIGKVTNNNIRKNIIGVDNL